jgi:hypothetical protein
VGSRLESSPPCERKKPEWAVSNDGRCHGGDCSGARCLSCPRTDDSSVTPGAQGPARDRLQAARPNGLGRRNAGLLHCRDDEAVAIGRHRRAGIDATSQRLCSLPVSVRPRVATQACSAVATMPTVPAVASASNS